MIFYNLGVCSQLLLEVCGSAKAWAGLSVRVDHWHVTLLWVLRKDSHTSCLLLLLICYQGDSTGDWPVCRSNYLFARRLVASFISKDPVIQRSPLRLESIATGSPSIATRYQSNRMACLISTFQGLAARFWEQIIFWQYSRVLPHILKLKGVRGVTLW